MRRASATRALTSASFGDFLGIIAANVHRPYGSCAGASCSYRETLTYAPPKSPSTGITHQEVFENELALATVRWSAALTTGQLLVRQTLFGFNTHELVLRAAPRTIERSYSRKGHDFREVGH